MDIDERRRIQELLDRAIQIKDIAKMLNRSHATISQEIKKNGGLRLYNAEKAQEVSDFNRLEGNKNKNGPIQGLYHRFDELEKRVKELELLVEEN
jgi:IS30 family transposase